MVQEVTQGALVTSKDVEFLNNNISVYFDIITEHTVSLQNQITDNYLENNTAVQDHIAQSPLLITLRGISGEVVFVPPSKTLNKIEDVTNQFLQDRINNENITISKLKALPALYPPVDNFTQLARNAVQYVEASYERYKKLYKRFSDSSSFVKIRRLREIYLKFKQLRDANTPLYVATPYQLFTNMYIQSVTFRQGNENYTSDIELTLKQLQFTDIKVTEADKEVLAQYNATARAPEENQGTVQGKRVDSETVLKSIRNNYFGGTYGSGIRR